MSITLRSPLSKALIAAVVPWLVAGQSTTTWSVDIAGSPYPLILPAPDPTPTRAAVVTQVYILTGSDAGVSQVPANLPSGVGILALNSSASPNTAPSASAGFLPSGSVRLLTTGASDNGGVTSFPLYPTRTLNSTHFSSTTSSATTTTTTDSTTSITTALTDVGSNSTSTREVQSTILSTSGMGLVPSTLSTTTITVPPSSSTSISPAQPTTTTKTSLKAPPANNANRRYRSDLLLLAPIMGGAAMIF